MKRLLIPSVLLVTMFVFASAASADHCNRSRSYYPRQSHYQRYAPSYQYGYRGPSYCGSRSYGYDGPGNYGYNSYRPYYGPSNGGFSISGPRFSFGIGF